MKIIFLNRYFHPDHSATSQMLSDLAFALAEQQHAVRIITSRQRYDAPGESLPAKETFGRTEVYRVWTSRFGRAWLPGRALDYLSFYATAGWCLLRLARSGEIVVLKTDPPLLSVIAAPLARLRGAIVVNWLQDVFPEVAEALGVGRKLPRPFLSALRHLRNHSLRKARANVVLGKHMAARLALEGIPEDRLHIIPNWADGTLISPIAPGDNPLRKAWGLDGKFVIGYSGNLGRAHEVETLVEAMELLKQEGAGPEFDNRTGAELIFLFIGGGALYEKLKGEVSKRGFSNVRFQPYQPRRNLARSLSCADVHLVSLKPELEGLIVPSKFYGIAAAGRPALYIGDPEGEIPRVLGDARCGLTVPVGDAAALAHHIQALAADPALCRAMGERARGVFEDRFEKNIAVGKWAALLGELS